MRNLVLFLLLLFLTACTAFKKPAPPLAMPLKPALKQSIHTLEYHSQPPEARVKSVQLPAHPLHRGQTYLINASQVGLSLPLRDTIKDIMTELGLKAVESGKVNYVLTVNQLDMSFGEDISFKLAKQVGPAQQLPATQECANLEARVGLKLTHKASGDVVWFAKASISSARFRTEPLVYQYKVEQIISNEKQVARFIKQQNTEKARLARADRQVTQPPYKVVDKINQPQKVSGLCAQKEVSALAPELHAHLMTLLLNKLEVRQ